MAKEIIPALSGDNSSACVLSQNVRRQRKEERGSLPPPPRSLSLRMSDDQKKEWDACVSCFVLLVPKPVFVFNYRGRERARARSRVREGELMGNGYSIHPNGYILMS